MWQPPDDPGAVPGMLSAAGARPWQVELTAGVLQDALRPAPA
jgi:hypothetical protein